MISVDDACRAHYATDPSRCGIGIFSGWNTQIMHQPAWSLFDALKLAGLDPVRDGYRIDPHLPMRSFSLRLPDAGIEYGARPRARLPPAARARAAADDGLAAGRRCGTARWRPSWTAGGWPAAGAGRRAFASACARAAGALVDWAVARP